MLSSVAILSAQPAARPNRVLELDGKGSFVEIPPNLFTNLHEATVEGWVKWSSFGSYARFFDFGNAERFMCVDNAEQGPTLQLEIWAPSGSVLVQVPNLLETNRWYHIAVVSGRAGTKLYVNGRLFRTNAFRGSFAAIRSGDHDYFGRSNRRSFGDADFQGQMDELRVWSTARNEQQIRDSQFKQLTGREPGLVGLWNFEAVNNGLVKDRSPGGHDGKLVGNAKVVEGNRPAGAEPPQLWTRAVPSGQIRDLRFAIQYAQVDKLKQLLRKEPGLVSVRYDLSMVLGMSAIPPGEPSRGATPLLEAVRLYGRERHGPGAEIHTPFPPSWSWTTVGKHKEVVSVLLKHQADFNTGDELGVTPLHVAALCYWGGRFEQEYEKADLIPLLLAHKADVNARDARGNTPLHVAARCSNEKAAALLVAHKADANAVNDQGLTALDVVAGPKSEPIARLLRAHGAKGVSGRPLPEREQALVRAYLDHRWDTVADRSAVTLLHLAAADGRADVVKHLLTSGSAVNATNRSGQTPLHLAAKHGQRGVATLLLASQANVSLKDGAGKTALLQATESRQAELVGLLLSHHADVNAPDNQGRTPVYCAAGSGYPDLVRRLLEQGAAANAKTTAEGWTPLHAALREWSTGTTEEIVELLLAHQAEVNARNREGETPLHIAVAMVEDEAKYTRLLLTHRALVNATNNVGQTPLFIAVYDGRVAAVKALLAERAEVNLRDKAGKTALQYALERQRSVSPNQDFRVIAELLRQAGAKE
ncbi:MAG: ankyrin repeat domain-containing protein [Verrucomicrobiota bacterium]